MSCTGHHAPSLLATRHTDEVYGKRGPGLRPSRHMALRARSTRVKNHVKKGKNEHAAVQTHTTQKRGRLFLRQITRPKCTTTT